MTYNVHSCIGSDRCVAPERIVQVIQDAHADVVALQEVDVEQWRTRRVHQAAWIAEELGMHFEFVSARECGGGQYGNAVLSRYPLEPVRHACLPRFRDRELRAVQWVRVDALGGVNVLNTHFGLSLRERALQAGVLLGEGWLGPNPRKTVLCGDFNARPGSRVHKSLCGVLCDAPACSTRPRALKTWPSRWPLMRLDHIFLSRDLRAKSCEVPRRGVERRASDHLPLVVDIEQVSGAP